MNYGYMNSDWAALVMALVCFLVAGVIWFCGGLT
jgi:hypothetical protein